MKKPFEDTTQDAINEARPEGAANADEPLDITRTMEVQDMPVEANIPPCGDSASEHTQNNWKSIGDLARALAEKSGGAK